MAIPSSFKDELVARSDIVDVVSDYVTLTPKGELLGLCPFHGEKDPLLPCPAGPAALPLLRLRQGGRRGLLCDGDGEPALSGCPPPAG